MIRSALAIARITIRHAAHSRALFWLLSGGIIPALLIPLLIEGDGTPEGTVAMISTYAPPVLFVVLLTGSIWLGCIALASERNLRQEAMIRTKPVRTLSLWSGKWLGVNACTLLVLLSSGLTYHAALQFRLKRIEIPPPVVWQPFSPDETELLVTARGNLDRWRSLAPDPHLIPTLEQEANRLRHQHYQAVARQPVSWLIPIEPAGNGDAWVLQFRFRLDPMLRHPIAGNWTIEPADAQTPLATLFMENRLDGNHQLPLDHFTPPPQTDRLRVRFTPDAETQPRIFFDSQSPVRLLLQTSSPPRNLWRAALVLVACSAAVSAISLLLSACLSFPVAVFSAYSTIIALLIATVAGALNIEHGHDHGPPIFGETLMALSGHILESVHHAASALQRVLPFQALSHSHIVPLQTVRGTLLVLLVGIPALCAILTAWRLSRHEVES